MHDISPRSILESRPQTKKASTLLVLILILVTTWKKSSYLYTLRGSFSGMTNFLLNQHGLQVRDRRAFRSVSSEECLPQKSWDNKTLPETNNSPLNRPSQKEIHLPTIQFQGPKMLVWGRVSTRFFFLSRRITEGSGSLEGMCVFFLMRRGGGTRKIQQKKNSGEGDFFLGRGGSGLKTMAARVGMLWFDMIWFRGFAHEFRGRYIDDSWKVFGIREEFHDDLAVEDMAHELIIYVFVGVRVLSCSFHWDG